MCCAPRVLQLPTGSPNPSSFAGDNLSDRMLNAWVTCYSSLTSTALIVCSCDRIKHLADAYPTMTSNKTFEVISFARSPAWRPRIAHATRSYFIFVILLHFAVATYAQQATDETIPVTVAVAALPPPPAPIEVGGTLVFKREIELSFKTTGIISKIAVETGQEVRKDDILAFLDTTELEARKKEAAAALLLARIALNRQRALLTKGFASQAAVDTAAAAMARATALRDVSAFDVEKAKLRAPADGVILDRVAEPKEMATATKVVLLLGDRSAGFVVTTHVSNQQVAFINVGDNATITLEHSAALVGKIYKIAPKADARTGTFYVELELDGNLRGLRSGQLADIRIPVESKRANDVALVAIPALALLEGRGDEASVFVVTAKDQVYKRSVEVDSFRDSAVLIKRGLSAGERVVTSGAPYLRNGQHVNVASSVKAAQ